MATYKFRILTDQVDSEHDRIVLSGVNIRAGKELFITKNFQDHFPVGVVSNIENTGNEIIATAEIPKEDPKGLYPCIGFNALESHIENNIRIIEKMELYCVSLCVNPNADPNIKPIE